MYIFLQFSVMVIVTSVSLDRLKVRKVASNSAKKRTVLNPRRSKRKLTAAEKATLREIRARSRTKWTEALEEAQEALREAALVMQAKVPGHQLDYYVRVITQSITSSNIKPHKNVTRWNAFVAQETRKRNAEREPGTAAIKTSDISKELSMQWHALSPEEQYEQTQEMVGTLQTAREVKKTGLHNTSLTAFHDARAVVGHIQTEIVNLHHRTGIEFLCFAVWKDIHQYSAPYVFRTSDLFDNFFHHITKYTLTDLALKLEAFFLGGVDGLARNYVERLVQLKSLTTSLIKEKLVNAAGHPISRMVYSNFDEAITLKHAVVLKGWPLPKFCCPSHLTGCSDLEILFNAWKSGAAHFVKLDDQEYKEWQSQYFQRRAGVAPELINPVSNGESINTNPPSAMPDAHPHVTNSPVNEVQPANIPTPATATETPTNPSPSALAPATSFVNFGADGSFIPPKARKTRKDKGVPRGRRKGKENKA
ncbi:hypothetical protein H1R20_g13548, partial [Candolleomyces eurysporus]